NGEQPPRIALVPQVGRQPRLVVVWTSKGSAGTTLLTARSDDGGRTFSRSSLVADTDAPGNRGWESSAADSRGRVPAPWLDHRQTAASMDHSGMHHPGQEARATATERRDGVARAQLSQLYAGWLDGESRPQAVTGGVCYCCKTALATDPGGALYAAWRHVY